MKKAPYIIIAPPYRNSSAGVRVLYKLGDMLKERGYKVEMSEGCPIPQGTICVYPEGVPGNPLGAETVVRYVLFYPGRHNGDKEFAQKEIVFTFDKKFYDAPFLTIPTIEDFFQDYGLKRSGACFWVGKGLDKPRVPETEGLIEITYDWPESRKELAQLLNQSEVFFTYDNCTALIQEARQCGCQVVVIGGEDKTDYLESSKDVENQLDEFIRITQEAARKEIKVSFGVLVNDLMRLDMVFRQSEINPAIPCRTIKLPETACKGLNKLLRIIESEGSDIAILSHQDMFYRNGWMDKVKEQINKLPENWVVAGIIGKDMKGAICGRMHDMRIPLHFCTDHEFPHPASCFDECCIIVNLKKGFRFDEDMPGFDLYGTYSVLQAKEQGGTAWIIDAFAEHYCMRSFEWYPGKDFEDCFKWIHRRFPNADRIDTTVLGVPKELEEKAA